ncbi:MAG: YaaR family protein [Treponema sp.]|nr:YaaR family protein [Treponema sp.]
MAKIDSSDPAIFMTPSAYSGVKDDKKNKGVRRGEKTDFPGFFDALLGKTADELGAVKKLPVSEESVNLLMDEVRDAGDVLKNRPLPEEILRYKQAVRNFISYVVQNTYTLEHEISSFKKFGMGFKGQRRTPEAMQQQKNTIIVVIDKKLEDLAAMLLTSQGAQLEILSRLEEIKGLLVDLLQ